MSETFILIQHGHAVDADDTPETDLVARTACYVAERFKPEILLSGPTNRCMSTAKVLGEVCHLSPTPEPALIPNCSTQDELGDRLMGVVTQLIGAHAGKTIAIVNHEISNQLIIARVMGMERRRAADIVQEPNSVTCLRHHENRWTLQSLNETAHLWAPDMQHH